VSFASDIFSFGAIIADCCRSWCKKLSQVDWSLQERAEDDKQKQLLFLVSLLTELSLECMAKNPSERKQERKIAESLKQIETLFGLASRI
jgi:hypothetical protein